MSQRESQRTENETKTELTVEQQIGAEQRKIKPLFKNLDKDKKRFIEKMIYQLAFLQVTLDRLVFEINNSDILVDFEQGTQKFKRNNPALRDYNATIKNYALLSKQLCDMLPDGEQERAGQALMSFVTKPK